LEINPDPVWAPYHIWQNVFYPTENGTNYILCKGGEDPNCSDQYNVLDTNWVDHYFYNGVVIGCNGPAYTGIFE